MRFVHRLYAVLWIGLLGFRLGVEWQIEQLPADHCDDASCDPPALHVPNPAVLPPWHDQGYIDIDGPIGQKHDNVQLWDVDGDDDLDITLSNEAKYDEHCATMLPIRWYENPGDNDNWTRNDWNARPWILGLCVDLEHGLTQADYDAFRNRWSAATQEAK